MPVTCFQHNQEFSSSSTIVRGGYRAAATSKMECFMIIVNTKLLLHKTIITKHSILDVAAVLDPPLKIVEKTDLFV